MRGNGNTRRRTRVHRSLTPSPTRRSAASPRPPNLVRRPGLDVDATIAAIGTGPAGSPHTKRIIRPMPEARRADSADLAIGLREKDARYCLTMAASLGMTIGQDAHN